LIEIENGKPQFVVKMDVKIQNVYEGDTAGPSSTGALLQIPGKATEKNIEGEDRNKQDDEVGMEEA